MVAHRENIHKLEKVTWIKSHCTAEQAAARGFTEEDRLGNDEADRLATQGLRMHDDDATMIRDYSLKKNTIHAIHKHILRQQTWLSEHKLLTFGEEGEYYERITGEKRKRYEHKTPLIDRELKKIKRIEQHNVLNYGKYDACNKCGRKTQATNDLRTRQHQWAPACQALPTFRPFLDKGRDLKMVEGDWGCNRCGRTGKWLVSSCSEPPDAAGHAIVHYGHADACHICGRYSLHTTDPVKANRKWSEPCKPAVRFYSYSSTHELELSERTWRCRWCHKKGKDLIAPCTGNTPQATKAFLFKKPTQQRLKRHTRRRFLGRPRQRPVRLPRAHRHRGRLRGGDKQLAWPTVAEAKQSNIFAPPKQGPVADKGDRIPTEYSGRPPDTGEAGLD